MDPVTGLSKVGQSVLRMGRLGLRRAMQTGLQVAEQLIGLLPGRHDELPQRDAAHQHEHAARVPVVAAAAQTARERRPDGTGPAVHVHAPTTPSVEATSAEIRAWARGNTIWPSVIAGSSPSASTRPTPAHTHPDFVPSQWCQASVNSMPGPDPGSVVAGWLPCPLGRLPRDFRPRPLPAVHRAAVSLRRLRTQFRADRHAASSEGMSEDRVCCRSSVPCRVVDTVSTRLGCPQGVRKRFESDQDGREWLRGVSAAHGHFQGLSSGFGINPRVVGSSPTGPT